jgi:hypothetical protein
MTTAPDPQQNSNPERPLRQRLFAFAILFILPIFLAYCAFVVAHAALPFKSGSILAVQVLALAIAGLLFVVAATIAIIPIRRKIRTGKFLLTPAEAIQYRRGAFAKLGAGKPAGPQVWLWLIPSIFSLILLSCGILLIYAVRCSCDGHISTGDIIGIILGAGIAIGGLVYPFLAIRRKIRTGYFLPSSEELAARRAKCARPQPLSARILVAGVWWFVTAIWTFSAVDHVLHPSRHISSSPWFAAASSCLAAVVWTFKIFRPRTPACALPLDDAPLPPPSDGPNFTLLDK